MAWTNIPDSSIDPDSPLRAVDMFALRDNPTAVAYREAGAPYMAPNIRLWIAASTTWNFPAGCEFVRITGIGGGGGATTNGTATTVSWTGSNILTANGGIAGDPSAGAGIGTARAGGTATASGAGTAGAILIQGGPSGVGFGGTSPLGYGMGGTSGNSAVDPTGYGSGAANVFSAEGTGGSAGGFFELLIARGALSSLSIVIGAGGDGNARPGLVILEY